MEKKDSGLGFVLLEQPEWDAAAFCARLQERWDIEILEKQEQDGALILEVPGGRVTALFVPAPVPNGEAEENAAFNFMWRDAVPTAKRHRAHIVLWTAGQNLTALQAGELFVKAAETALSFDNAIGLYANGTVYQPEYYADAAQMMRKGEAPIFNLVWMGLCRGENSIRAYTIGLEALGKREIEILDVHGKPSQLLNFVSRIVGYIVDSDVTLNSGETIGVSADQRLKITLSQGVEFPDTETLKIESPF